MRNAGNQTPQGGQLFRLDQLIAGLFNRCQCHFQFLVGALQLLGAAVHPVFKVLIQKAQFFLAKSDRIGHGLQVG